MHIHVRQVNQILFSVIECNVLDENRFPPFCEAPIGVAVQARALRACFCGYRHSALGAVDS